jgi:hypothetical protein
MNFSVATHLCGGNLAAVKVSFSEKLAGCGMKMDEPVSSLPTVKPESCCQNHLNVLKVDNKYNPSSFQILNVDDNLLQIISTPIALFDNSNSNIYKQYYTIPPGIALVNSVNLSDICIFRI